MKNGIYAIKVRRGAFLLAVAAAEMCRAVSYAPNERMDEGLFQYAFAGTPAPVYYRAPHALEKGDLCTLAVVLIHGWGGGCGTSMELGPLRNTLAVAVGTNSAAPYVIEPQFPRREIMKLKGLQEDGRAVWNDSWGKDYAKRGLPDDDWRGGGDAVGLKLSSFEVIDGLFSVLGDRRLYPNLKRVVMTGFSAGGQFVGRYVAVGKGFVRDGVDVAYAAMAPSTELLLDPNVRWHYGLKDRPRYAAHISAEQILANLSSRRVWRGCGTEDVLGVPYTALDSCPEAMAQGPNRYMRFRNFERYVARYPEWAARVSFHAFAGIGHKTVLAHTDPAFIAFVVEGQTGKGNSGE